MELKKFIRLIIEQNLNEEIQNNLYHYTNVDSLIKILKDNKINLSSSLGTEADNYGHKSFFLSTARTPSLDAGFPNSGNRTYRLVLDKEKLKQKFKTEPVDYWQRKDPENPTLKGLRPNDRKVRMNRDFEFEERIYSDKPYLDNALNYIKEIEAYVPPDNLNDEKIKSHLIAIRDAARSHNIPIGIYQNKADLFKKQNSIADTLQSTEQHEPYERNLFSSSPTLEGMFSLIFYNQKYIRDYDLFKVDFDKFKTKNNLSNYEDRFKNIIDTYKTHDRMVRLQYSNDGIQGLLSDLHNTFKSGVDDIIRKNITYLSNDMKRNNVSSIQQLYNLKVNGFKPKKENIDYSNKIQLTYKSYDDEPNQIIPNNTPIKKVKGLYFNSYKYGGFMNDEDMGIYFNMETNNKTIGDFVNYIYNKYTPNKADELFQKAAKIGEGGVIITGLTNN